MTLSVQIKQCNLVHIVESEGVQLRRQGDRHAGCCPFPFHTDAHPSFFVYPDNHFKCFGCGEYGDAVDFIQRLHGCDFKTACQHLGIEVGTMTAVNRNRITDLKRIRKQRELHRRRESDLAFTLGTLIRQTRCAMTALTPDNLGDYADLIGRLPYYEYAHDLLIHGSSDQKVEVIYAFKDFQTINRNKLWNQDFDYKGWLRKCQQIGEPNEKKVKNFFS